MIKIMPAFVVVSRKLIAVSDTLREEKQYYDSKNFNKTIKEEKIEIEYNKVEKNSANDRSNILAKLSKQLLHKTYVIGHGIFENLWKREETKK